MNESWLVTLKKATKTCIQQGNLRKVHYELDNGREMVEEYNMDTSVLSRRAWRTKTNLGGEGHWEVEIGDPEPKPGSEEAVVIKESSNQPVISRRVTKLYLEWRIRNLSYPPEVYSVTADAEKRCMTVRTTNKKYFKNIPIPELDRIGLVPVQINIGFSHKFNTLIITYKKPQEVRDFENEVFAMVNSLKPKGGADMDYNNCKPS